MVYSNLEN